MVSTKDLEVDNILGYVNQQVMDLTLKNSKIDDGYKMGSAFDERMKKYESNPTDVPGLSVGMPKFDRVTRGAIPGDLIIVVAESKTGKSVILLNWAKHIAIDLQLPILWIDSEQSNEEEELRLISNISQVPEDEIKTGLFTQDTAYGKAQDKILALNHAKYLLNNSNFHHIYMSDFTLDKIIAIARKFHLKYGIVALFFDYIKLNPNLIAQNKSMRTDLVLTTLTTGLKNIGGDLKIPVFTAAQENRTGYGNQTKDARNIGESLGILQLATKLCFLRNLSDEEIACSQIQANQELYIAYQRHGLNQVKIPILYKRPTLTQIEAKGAN
jgi:replicative DNA helicase